MTNKIPHRLIVFTRFPEAGTAKTRLIPQLGAQGAADVQRRLTEQLTEKIRVLTDTFPLAVEVCFEGGGAGAMARWLGNGFAYRPQGGGDIGERMARAFERVFRDGGGKAVLVGSDIPGLTGDLIREAFDALESDDLVLGPARDGGYYLVGLKRTAAELFQDVPWGTERVLERTLEIAEDLGLSARRLETLRDLDRPEDLEAWENESKRNKREKASVPIRLSVIIPALNEAARIGKTLDCIWRNHSGTVGSRTSGEGSGESPWRDFASLGLEAIVADGGSDDDTMAVARARGARVVTAPRGRGGQMDAGAARATGDFFLFLHADTLLPKGYDGMIRSALCEKGVAVGAFAFSVDASGSRFRRLERMVNWRSVRLQMPYGDQGIFLRSETFREVGGFADMPILEDVDLIRRVRRKGRIANVREPVLISARRWEKIGVWRSTWVNLCMIAGYYAGISPARLARFYYRGKGK